MKEVLYFGATWCAPCKRLGPIVEELRAENPEVTFRKIDVDEEPEEAKTYQVRALPTLVYLEDGKEVERVLGFTAKQEITTAFKL